MTDWQVKRAGGLKHWSWAEYLTWVDSPYPKHRKGESSHKENDDWSGDSWENCLRMAKVDGYQAVTAQADGIAESLSDLVRERVRTMSRKPALAVNGRKLVVSRYLSGHPKCTMRMAPTKVAKQGRAVRIAVPIAYSCTVTVTQVMRRGAAVLALVRILRQLGHPLDVWAVDARTSRLGRTVDAIQVQPADEPADDGRIMFALAHPGMLRRLGFASNEHEPASFQTGLGVGRGYGAPSGALVNDLPDTDSGTSIVLPELDYHTARRWEDDAYCIQWITDQLDAIFGED